MIKPQEREREREREKHHTVQEMVGRLLKEKKPNKSAEALFQDKHTVMLKLYHASLKIHPLRSELSSTSPSPPPQKKE